MMGVPSCSECSAQHAGNRADVQALALATVPVSGPPKPRGVTRKSECVAAWICDDLPVARFYDVRMQRLFSMFPIGSPGVALLLLRIALSVLLLDGVLPVLSRLGPPWLLLAPWAIAIGLCLGLATPFLVVAAIVIEAGTWWASGASLGAVHACAILDATALGLLGPGGYSLDGRLFGRRRIVFPPGDSERS